MSHSVEEMTALYDEYDKNGDGKVSVHELKAGIKAKFCADVDDKKVVVSFWPIYFYLQKRGNNKKKTHCFLFHSCKNEFWSG